MSTRPNKRRFLRTRAQNLVAHLRVGDRSIQAPVEDISMGGLLARTTESIPIGTAVMFDLARPGLKRPLRLLGVVVDTRMGRGLGIRFDGLDKEASDRLGELLGALGGMTSPLLADRPEPPDVPPPALRGAWPAPVTTAAPLAPVAMPGGPTENEKKLQAQVRSMVMELGRLQELVQQREKELHDARAEIARLKNETSTGDAVQRVVGRLEIEKGRLETQLADVRAHSRAEADLIQRDAETAAAALSRVLDAVERLR